MSSSDSKRSYKGGFSKSQNRDCKFYTPKNFYYNSKI